jgi:hypothetical protein
MKPLALYAFCALLFSCSTAEKSQVPIEIDLKELISDTLYLEKDSITKDLGSDFSLVNTDSGSYLFTFRRHTLYQYSYPEGKIVNKTKFENEGPDGIGGFISGYLIDDGSIYFISNNKWIEANFAGKVLERTNLPEATPARLAVNYSTFPFNRIYKIGEEFLISDVPFVLKESLLDYENWILKFDPNSKKVGHISFRYPESHHRLLDDQTFAPFNHTLNIETAEFVFSFPATDSLLILSEGTEKWVSAAPKESMKFIKGTTEQAGEWTVFHPSEESSYYSWVHFEPLSKSYLRLSVITPKSDESQKQGVKPLTKLLVLDAAFEKKAEVTLHDKLSGFQTPKGFYIRLGYISGEDEVAFGRMDFSKINP